MIPPPADHPSPVRRGRDRAILYGIVFLVLVAYLPALSGGFIWDDDAYVTQNDTLNSVAGLRRIWFEPGATPQYYPVVFSTFWIEHRLWGAHALGYHVVNVCLHALNAVLVWRIARRLGIRGALFAGLLFALHPVHVESVAWITERKNVLSGVFYLLSMSAYLRFAGLDSSPQGRSGSGRSYALSLVLFLCALLSKTVTATLPAAALLLIWWKRGRLGRRDFLNAAPMLVLGAALASVTVWMEMNNLRGTGRGAVGPEWDLSAIDRLLVAGRAAWFYAGKLVWPAGLTFIYPRWPIDSAAWPQYGWPAGAVALMVALWWMRHRLGRGALAAVLFFLGTLSPALGFFNVYPFRYSFVADHFQYLASVGLIALFASAWSTVARRWLTKAPLMGRVFPAALLTTLGVLVWHNGHTYADLETLWLDTLAKNPGCWMAHNNLGNVYGRRGEAEAAIAHYQAALRINPDLDEPYYNMGVALAMLGRTQEALEAWRATLRVNPEHAKAARALRQALAEQSKK